MTKLRSPRATRVRNWLSQEGFDRRCILLGLGALLVLGVGSWWGLPQATHPVIVRGWDVDGIGGINVLSELHNLLVDPKGDWYTAYPLLHYLVLAAAYAPYLLLLVLTGGLTSPTPDFPFGLADPVATLAVMGFIGRLITLVMAAGTVMLTYITIRRLFDTLAATIGAVLIVILGPMVFYARTSNLDVPVLFWTVAGIFFVVQALQRELTPKVAALIAVCAAFAVATKDQSYGAWLGILGYLAYVHLRRAPRVFAPITWRPLVVLVLVGLALYATANGVPFRPARMVSHIRFITGFETNFFNLQHPTWIAVLRPATLSGYASLVGDMARAVYASMNPLLIVAGLVGVAQAWRATPASRVYVFAVLGFIVFTLVPIRHMQYRYALMIAYSLSVFAGVAFAQALRGESGARTIGTVLLASALGWQVFRGIDLTYQMVRDARYAAGEWLESELEYGSTIGFFGVRHQLPYVPAGVDILPLSEDGVKYDLSVGYPEYLIVAPDYFSDPDRERSTFLPDSLYRELLDGSAGYDRVAHFITRPLTGRPLAYLPYVNPQVQVFRYRGED